KVIHHIADKFVVACFGNRRRRHNDRVLSLKLYIFVVTAGHALQRRARLALSAGGNNNDFVVLHVWHIANRYKRTLWDTDHTELNGNLKGTHHTTTVHGNLAPMLSSGVYKHLNTVNVAR